MDVQPNSRLLHNFPVDNLISYLTLTDWQVAESPDNRWLIFQGASDIQGEPLEIVLLKNSQAPDISVYLSSAINLLSALNNEPPEFVVKRVKFYDRDILNVRNLETGEYDSIPIDLASRQVSRLKQLVAYSARSEDEPKPYFASDRSRSARQMMKHYRFGHTFPGSFGFTVESQVVRQIFVYKQKSFIGEDIVILPIERRVMERIVRGLIATKQATASQDLQRLVQEYSSGFNANMCDTIIRMSDSKSMPLEYMVMWSPKIKPSEDLASFEPVRLSEPSYRFLEAASEALRAIEPEIVTIKGLVTGLSSKDNPLGDSETQRSVIIRWIDRPEGRPVSVIVKLDKDDYIKANNAHINWSTIQVSGTISKVGSIWRLSDPHDFKVLN